MTPSLALLHGFTGGPRSFEPVTRLLPAGLSILAPALSGHGHPAGEIRSFEDEVDRLAALLERGGAPLCVAGYSLGARLALGLLVRHPALFSSAVLVGGNPGLESEAARALRLESDERLCGILERQGIAAFVRHWEALPLFASQTSLPTTVLDAQRAARLARDPLELARSLRATGLARMPSYWDALPAVKVPVAVVAGERDEKFRSLAARMTSLLPRATLHVVPGAGHNVVLEAPAALAEILRQAMEPRP